MLSDMPEAENIKFSEIFLALMNEIPKFLGTPEIAGKSKDLKILLQRLGQKKKKKIKGPEGRKISASIRQNHS
jgi:hypothetical protein